MKLVLTTIVSCALFLGACQKDKKNDVQNGSGGNASADSTANWDGMSHRGNSKFSATAVP